MPACSWLRRSYARWSLAWSLFSGASIAGALLLGRAPTDVALGMGVFQ
jgi:hypothetical protein